MDFVRDARNDPHAVAGVVKLFLQVRRVLPSPAASDARAAQDMDDPLLTAELYNAWIEAISAYRLRLHVSHSLAAMSEDEEVLVSCLRRISNLLPPGNKAIFLRLLGFFSSVRSCTSLSL